MLVSNYHLQHKQNQRMPLAERQRHKGEFSQRKEILTDNFDKINTEGPSKINSQDLSFGVSLLSVKVDKLKPVKAKEIIDFYKNSPLGDMPKKLYESLSKSDSAKNFMRVGTDGNITFHKKSILRLIWDGATYPFVQLPQDILNGTVELLGKFKPLEKWSKDVLATDLFKGIRRRSKEDAKVNSFRGLAQLRQKLISENKSEDEIRRILFERSTKMFDPKTGNYDTKHERVDSAVQLHGFFVAEESLLWQFVVCMQRLIWGLFGEISAGLKPGLPMGQNSAR